MMHLRRPTDADALAYWIHVQAMGERVFIPDVAARMRLACLALLTVAPEEVAAQLREAGGGLDELAHAMAKRLAALGVPADVINASSARAMGAVSALAVSTFAPEQAQEQPRAVSPMVPEPPEGAPVEVTLAYHAALGALSAYTTALKAG